MRRLSSLPGTEVLGSRAGEKNAGGGNLAENNAAPQPDPSSSPDTDKRSNAASIVAWVESAAQKRQAVQLEIWDDKWDRAWKKRWSETWESGWSKLALLKVTPRGVGKIGKLGELLAVVGTASADGKISGRTAGRVPIDASLVSRTLEHPATPGPVTNISRNNKTKEADHALPKPKDIPPVQLEDWRSERYPTLHQKWAPVWQTASDMAWESTWGKAECAGKEKAVELMKSYNPPEKPPATEGVASAQSKRPKTEAKSKTKPPEQGVLTPEVNSGPRSAQLGKIVATVVVKMRQTKRDGTRRKQEPRGSQYEKELEVETKVKDLLPKNPPHMPPGLATKLAEHAWSEAKLIPGSAEAGLDEWAKHALQSTRRLDSVLPYLAKLMPLKHQGGTEDIWEKVFASTWETTWKRSWEAAWAAVWEESAKDAWEKGVQEGIDIALEEKLPNDWSATLSETGKSSYRQLNASLEGTKSYMDTLWNIRSNFEALTQLHDALHHSVPTYHEGAMEIKISPKRNLYTAISKKLELTEAESQVPRKSTHVDLQTDIKQLINPDTIAQMSKIWAIATDVYQDLNFLPNDQDSEKNLETKPNDRSARPEHPGSGPASEPILSSAKTAEVDIPSIETVAKIQEQ
ncbi:hypothetical protein BDV93DRAFT_512546 [Ceratobasidium sp. AG-I]|nr:hypothetical protein BDV93DRAFT_512546 [Ceratobasidium sp. AG-I]